MTANMQSKLWAIILTVTFAATPGRTQSILGTLLGGSPNGLPALTASLNMPAAVAPDANGNVYVALKSAHQVVRIDSAGIVSTVAGNGIPGALGDGGQATSAELWTPVGLAVDQAGALYICDSTASRIRRVGLDGIITTIAGNGKNTFSGDGGPASGASLSRPGGIAFDNSGDLLIADAGNEVVRMVTPDGLIRTIAGIPKDGGASGNAGPALEAQLNNPQSVVVDSGGIVYIADTGNNWIRSLTPDGTISIYAGLDTSTTTSPFGGGGDPTIATNARLTTPTSLAMDQAGTLYFVEPNRVRQITSNGKIAPFAGTGTYGGSGDGGLARFANVKVQGIATDSHNNLLIADGDNNRVRIVTAADGTIDTVAGNGLASFNPRGLAVKGSYLYFSDSSNNRVRRLNLATQEISLVAGDGAAGYTGDGGSALSASLKTPRGLAFDPSGNLYIADTGNHRIAKVGTDGTIDTIAGNGTASTTGDGLAATSATLNTPAAVAVDASGNLFISEQLGNVVRKVNASGVISTAAGTGTAGAPDSESGVAVNQKLNGPQGLAWDSTGGLLIADSGNHRIRRLSSDGTIATVAGTVAGFSGDGGPATSAALKGPNAVQVDQAGNLYISDAGNYRIRRVGADGVISTVAGNGSSGYNGDGSPATAYTLFGPSAVVSAASGCSAFIADSSNLRIRQLWPAVDYTVTATAPGLLISLDGQVATAPLKAALLPGTHHRVSAPSPQSGGLGVRYLISAAQEFDVPCGPARASVTLNFQPQYGLTVTSDPGGTVTSAATWQDAAASVTLVATPQSGFVFAAWEGDCTGSASCTLMMNGPKNVKADFAPAVSLNPAIATGGIVGAGLSTPQVNALSPNGIAIVFGTGFAPAGTLSVAGAGNLLNGSISTELNGVCVLVGATRAPILAVTPTQVNFQTPLELTPGTVSVQVVTGCGSVNEARSALQTVTAQNASPEFFYFAHAASGQNPITSVNASTGVFVGTPGLLTGGTFAPAKPGDVLTLYATGLGLTNSSFATGQLPGTASSIAGDIEVTIGSTTLAKADVLYAGVTPSTAGLYQINIHLPLSIPSGDQPVKMTISGIASPSGGYITVKQ
jgi:uncharacterized protein (TIGR03437 family)